MKDNKKIMNVVIWMDCRGEGLKYFLSNKIKCNIYKYLVHELGGFNISPPGYLNDSSNIPIDVLKTCDIFLYQFIDKKFLKYSTDPSTKDINVLSHLSDDCIKIGFHGVYMDCFWPLTTPFKNEYNKIIQPLKGKSKQEIEYLYKKNLINFYLEERFDNNIKYALEREKKWKDGYDSLKNYHVVSSVNFIKKNFTKGKLFLTHCHPTSYIFIDQVNQILKIINNDSTDIYENIFDYPMMYPGIPYGTWPESKYVNKIFNINYSGNIVNENYYINLILEQVGKNITQKNYNKIKNHKGMFKMFKYS